MRINWGSGIYPQKPLPGEAFEEVARTFRYRLLFDAMTDLKLDCLAMGHHLDDQVETMIMRYMWGTRGTGLAGMRPIRRWGMGESGPSHSTSWFGVDGMKRWVIRPLLTAHKVRSVLCGYLQPNDKSNV